MSTGKNQDCCIFRGKSAEKPKKIEVLAKILKQHEKSIGFRHQIQILNEILWFLKL